MPGGGGGSAEPAIDPGMEGGRMAAMNAEQRQRPRNEGHPIPELRHPSAADRQPENLIVLP